MIRILYIENVRKVKELSKFLGNLSYEVRLESSAYYTLKFPPHLILANNYLLCP